MQSPGKKCDIAGSDDGCAGPDLLKRRHHSWNRPGRRPSMFLFFSLAIAGLYAAVAYLMLKRDLIRLIAGMILIGNAANLFIMASALRRGEAPILPLEGEGADPLVQAMVLTAIVISFAVAALALALVYRVYTSHYSV